MEDLIQNLRNKIVKLELASNLWGTFDVGILSILHSTEWRTFKYFDERYNINKEIEDVDNTKGGIYIFYISPEIIPERQRVLMYVGRAHITQSQNIRKRISEYKGYLSDGYPRPRITTMLKEWGQYLYCSYITFDDNDMIDKIEKELINKLIPPCNSEIPDITISKAVRAIWM